MIKLPTNRRRFFLCTFLLIASACDKAPTSPTDTGVGVGHVEIGAIAFVERSALMVMSPDGSAQSFLTWGSQPSWSWDGKTIVYAASDCHDDGCAGFLQFIDVATRRITRLPKTASGVDPAWSPVDDVIAYINIESGELYLYDIADETPRKVIIPGPASLYVFHPSWSPDGSRIVAACREGSSRGRLCVFKSDGSDFRYLTPESDIDDRNPSWSPDGSRIVFERFGISVINADGSGLRVLPVDGASPSWSPDSREIVFSGVNGIARINSDGTGMRQLTTGRNFPHSSPVWTR